MRTHLQGEIGSLSCELAHPSSELVVSLFEVPFTPAAVAAFIEREHEFSFRAVSGDVRCTAGWAHSTSEHQRGGPSTPWSAIHACALLAAGGGHQPS